MAAKQEFTAATTAVAGPEKNVIDMPSAILGAAARLDAACDAPPACPVWHERIFRS
jgi:hypothetical protein